MGGLGEVLPAPGTTAGSLPAAFLWWALAVSASRGAVLVFTALAVVLASVVGVWAATEESRRCGREDPGSVVIDEVAGQWLTLLVVLLCHPSIAREELWKLTVAGFFAFRFFDILKVWPVNRLEELPGGLGIMADDLAAGLWAAVVLSVVWIVL